MLTTRTGHPAARFARSAKNSGDPARVAPVSASSSDQQLNGFRYRALVYSGVVPRVVATGVYLLFMSVFVAWLVLAGSLRGLLCGAIVAGLAGALWLIRPGCRRRYSLGVAVGLLTIWAALWPTGAVCGSVLSPGQEETSVDWGPSPAQYIAQCDHRAGRNGAIVLVGGMLSGLLIGSSLGRGSRPGRARHGAGHASDRPETTRAT